MKQFFSLLLISIFFVACKKESTTGTETLIAEKSILNVSYGPEAGQNMDVYLPANRSTTDTKILIMVHGGAWSTGDKADFKEFLPVFKQRLQGYAFFNINYRLAKLPGTNTFPAQENDIKKAFEYIVSKADEYSFNKEKLAVLGASAGGHLALLQSYKHSDSKVKALINMFGPTDMIALYNNAGSQLEQLSIQALLSGTPTTNSTLYQSSSPINYVSAQSPPTLILHGGKDPLVPVSQSMALKEKLQQANVPVQMTIYANEGHGWTGTNLTDSYEKIAAFLKEYNP